MIKKNKILIAVGGTGGHVFPGYNLAKHLEKSEFNVKLITDKRGSQYLKKIENLKFTSFPSSPIISKNIFSFLLSIITIIYSILISFVFLIFNRPAVIFGMGGYASFPICLAASILKINLIIYENNLVIGKANKFLLPFAKKLIVSFKDLEGVPKKYQEKISEIGNIIKEEIINYSRKTYFNSNNKISVLVLGGSQAAKIFAEVLPNIFYECKNQGINMKIYQHCLQSQNAELKLFYEKYKIEHEIFNFNTNLIQYFSKVNLAITRAGSSMLAELTNANIPFIAVPLPSSADNHQLKNAKFYENKNYSLLIEEKDLKLKLLKVIENINGNDSILNKITENQRQHSDKNVYKNIDEILKEIINEKN